MSPKTWPTGNIFLELWQILGSTEWVGGKCMWKACGQRSKSKHLGLCKTEGRNYPQSSQRPQKQHWLGGTQVAGDHQHWRGVLSKAHAAMLPRKEGGQFPARIPLPPFSSSVPSKVSTKSGQSWCACHAGASVYFATPETAEDIHSHITGSNL